MIVSFAVENTVSLRFPKLDIKTLKVFCFANLPFADKRDFTSHLGYIIFLCDRSSQAAFLAFKSYKARRVIRSVMGAELIAFNKIFDVVHTITQELRYCSGTDPYGQ